MPQISKHCTVMPTLNESERQQLLSVEPSILAILGTAEQDTVACQEQSSQQVSPEENILYHTLHIQGFLFMHKRQYQRTLGSQVPES